MPLPLEADSHALSLSVNVRSQRLFVSKTLPVQLDPSDISVVASEIIFAEGFDSIVLLKTSAGNKEEASTPPNCDY